MSGQVQVVIKFPYDEGMDAYKVVKCYGMVTSIDESECRCLISKERAEAIKQSNPSIKILESINE